MTAESDAPAFALACADAETEAVRACADTGRAPRSSVAAASPASETLVMLLVIYISLVSNFLLLAGESLVGTCVIGVKTGHLSVNSCGVLCYRSV